MRSMVRASRLVLLVVALPMLCRGATVFSATDISLQGTARSHWVLIARVRGDGRTKEGSESVSFLPALEGRVQLRSIDNGKLSYSSPDTPYLVLVETDETHDWYALRGHLWEAHVKLKRAGSKPGAAVEWTRLPTARTRRELTDERRWSEVRYTTLGCVLYVEQTGNPRICLPKTPDRLLSWGWGDAHFRSILVREGHVQEGRKLLKRWLA